MIISSCAELVHGEVARSGRLYVRESAPVSDLTQLTTGSDMREDCNWMVAFDLFTT